MAKSDKSANGEEKAAVDESGSSPIQSGGVLVPDDGLQRRRLTHGDIRFLARVLDMMNRDAPNYTLLNHMSAFKDGFGNLNVQRLAEQNLLEEGRVCSRKYYTVLPAGRELLGQKFGVGLGQGDISEKTPYKVGVRLLERWLDPHDDVARVKPYYEYDEETAFDVAGLSADEELVWVDEVELQGNNKYALVDDYGKQSAVDANAVWAFNRHETAVEVLGCLTEIDRIRHSVGGHATRRFSDIREAVKSLNAEGMTTIRNFNRLDEEFNS